MPALACASDRIVEDAPAATGASFALADALDLRSACRRFRDSGRVQLTPLLSPASAERLYQALDRNASWSLAFNHGAQVNLIEAGQLTRLEAPERAEILSGIHHRARTRFQFVYSLVPLLSDYFDRSAPDCALFELFEFLNAPGFLAAMRRVSGLAEIRWADCQATRFRAGQFLTSHSDMALDDCRLAAYVLHITRGWRRDWGGYLQFFDRGLDIEAAFCPGFNILNLFAIPADHSVQQVASYCPESRYAITGWLRGDAPPPGIGWRADRR